MIWHLKDDLLPFSFLAATTVHFLTVWVHHSDYLSEAKMEDNSITHTYLQKRHTFIYIRPWNRLITGTILGWYRARGGVEFVQLNIAARVSPSMTVCKADRSHHTHTHTQTYTHVYIYGVDLWRRERADRLFHKRAEQKRKKRLALF